MFYLTGCKKAKQDQDEVVSYRAYCSAPKFKKKKKKKKKKLTIVDK
jgi:hypothetical protein